MNPTITKPDHQDSPSSTAAQAWGTWEDLLLSYAVNRFGTKNWTSICSELQKRTSDPTHITPLCCEQKYRELKRRFNQSDEDDVGLDDVTVVPWLDELREVRVMELQRQLRNYDLYILSLQTKVKKLTEESEKTGNTNDAPEPENQSVNGSTGNQGTGNEKSETGNGEKTGEPDSEEPVRSEPDGSETKREGKEWEVQSLVSRSTNEGVPRGNRKEEDECIDSVPVRSLPLVDILERVQKAGSVVFERRLDRQEKLRYKNLIKQHIDYNTLQTRLKQGWYSDGNHTFFRDLLLLVNNTSIFFPKQSPEAIAAVDLQQLILKEMIMISKKKQKTSSNMPPKRVADAPDSLLLKPKLDAPIVVCRKRSSITAKAAAGKKEQTGSKGSSNSGKLMEENMKNTRDSFPLGKKKKGKSPESSDTKPEKKKRLTEAEEKKQGAAKFLNRIKRSNELLKSTLSGGDGKKDQAGKKSSGGRQVKEEGSPTKRNVGRPPKRAAAPTTLVGVSGKRSRESVDSEWSSKQTKNRSKR